MNSKTPKQKIVFMIMSISILFTMIHCDDHHSGKGHDHEHEPLLAASEPTKGSLLELKNQWTNEEGKTVQFVSWKGKPFLISMFYASCLSICPRLVADLEQVAKKIESKTGKVPQVILVSFDSEKDKPEALKAYKQKMGLGPNWSLLHGEEETIRMLSVVLGINYKKMENGDFNHSAVITLFDKEGKNVARIEGIGAEVDNLISAFADLSKN
ncbi:SCO family protein [Leptospira kemamanensis]|uniref:SCO family protein n=1 Tax=Leptospira kemamanensis TaxID=2484942 RepID=A0A4R9JL48_9LEPT|nr:SCO family protein [Leptospira kemamanensis]TGL47303.1 SCO family protein [Leptospira kemamanensis]